ncbi:MAG: peptidylprolyl isomerase [Chitinophagales bacterium]|nr:peptidylprolyl isomerase [Chitinophagales bacterium]MCB9021159.1 peptidylprolyl isomerase [Chitinophagales bacterium]
MLQPETEQTEPMDNQPEQIVKISTSYGDMLIKLYNETPKHRDNFIKLVKEGYYNGLLFHRVMQEFMVQGGDPDSRNAAAGARLGSGSPGYTIPAEFRKDLFHKKGALAAARQPDQVNPQKASSGSQFYIVQGKPTSDDELAMMGQRMGITFTEDQMEVYRTLGGTPFLDQNYTVFGEVISGMEVIDKIAAVQTDANDRPREDIKMTITLEEE